MPEVDLARKAFGPLRFGDPLEAARPLGRPDSFRRLGHEAFQLLYARAGYQLEFEDGRFECLVFFVGPRYGPRHRRLHFSRPVVAGGPRLGRGTGREEIERHFGPPEAADADEEETVLRCRRDDLILEFELDDHGQLKRWSVFPERPPA